MAAEPGALRAAVRRARHRRVLGNADADLFGWMGIGTCCPVRGHSIRTPDHSRGVSGLRASARAASPSNAATGCFLSTTLFEVVAHGRRVSLLCRPANRPCVGATTPSSWAATCWRRPRAPGGVASPSPCRHLGGLRSPTARTIRLSVPGGARRAIVPWADAQHTHESPPPADTGRLARRGRVRDGGAVRGRGRRAGPCRGRVPPAALRSPARARGRGCPRRQRRGRLRRPAPNRRGRRARPRPRADRGGYPAAMTRTVRALMSGLIDYAGLFPPARLAMDAAEEYARARRARRPGCSPLRVPRAAWRSCRAPALAGGRHRRAVAVSVLADRLLPETLGAIDTQCGSRADRSGGPLPTPSRWGTRRRRSTRRQLPEDLFRTSSSRCGAIAAGSWPLSGSRPCQDPAGHLPELSRHAGRWRVHHGVRTRTCDSRRPAAPPPVPVERAADSRPGADGAIPR